MLALQQRTFLSAVNAAQARSLADADATPLPLCATHNATLEQDSSTTPRCSLKSPYHIAYLSVISMIDPMFLTLHASPSKTNGSTASATAPHFFCPRMAFALVLSRLCTELCLSRGLLAGSPTATLPWRRPQSLGSAGSRAPLGRKCVMVIASEPYVTDGLVVCSLQPDSQLIEMLKAQRWGAGDVIVAYDVYGKPDQSGLLRLYCGANNTRRLPKPFLLENAIKRIESQLSPLEACLCTTGALLCPRCLARGALPPLHLSMFPLLGVSPLQKPLGQGSTSAAPFENLLNSLSVLRPKEIVIAGGPVPNVCFIVLHVFAAIFAETLEADEENPYRRTIWRNSTAESKVCQASEARTTASTSQQSLLSRWREAAAVGPIALRAFEESLSAEESTALFSIEDDGKASKQNTLQRAVNRNVSILCVDVHALIPNYLDTGGTASTVANDLDCKTIRQSHLFTLKFENSEYAEQSGFFQPGRILSVPGTVVVRDPVLASPSVVQLCATSKSFDGISLGQNVLSTSQHANLFTIAKAAAGLYDVRGTVVGSCVTPRGIQVIVVLQEFPSFPCYCQHTTAPITSASSNTCICLPCRKCRPDAALFVVRSHVPQVDKTHVELTLEVPPAGTAISIRGVQDVVNVVASSARRRCAVPCVGLETAALLQGAPILPCSERCSMSSIGLPPAVPFVRTQPDANCGGKLDNGVVPAAASFVVYSGEVTVGSSITVHASKAGTDLVGSVAGEPCAALFASFGCVSMSSSLAKAETIPPEGDAFCKTLRTFLEDVFRHGPEAKLSQIRPLSSRISCGGTQDASCDGSRVGILDDILLPASKPSVVTKTVSTSDQIPSSEVTDSPNPQDDVEDTCSLQHAAIPPSESVDNGPLSASWTELLRWTGSVSASDPEEGSAAGPVSRTHVPVKPIFSETADADLHDLATSLASDVDLFSFTFRKTLRAQADAHLPRTIPAVTFLSGDVLHVNMVPSNLMLAPVPPLPRCLFCAASFPYAHGIPTDFVETAALSLVVWLRSSQEPLQISFVALSQRNTLEYIEAWLAGLDEQLQRKAQALVEPQTASLEPPDRQRQSIRAVMRGVLQRRSAKSASRPPSSSRADSSALLRVFSQFLCRCQAESLRLRQKLPSSQDHCFSVSDSFELQLMESFCNHVRASFQPVTAYPLTSICMMHSIHLTGRAMPFVQVPLTVVSPSQ